MHQSETEQLWIERRVREFHLCFLRTTLASI
jgi:hypothetical protein